MPQYAALTFTRDVDWTAPEQAGAMADWNEFRDAAMTVIRGGAALYPTPSATTVRVSEKGGEVPATDGPYTETKQALDGIDGLEGYALWHATRGVLLRRLGRSDEADAADARAAALPLHDAQRSLLGHA